MAEGAIKPEIEGSLQNELVNTTKEKHAQSVVNPQVDTNSSRIQIIWTPRFIISFALTLILGLSIASLLTQGWLDGFYSGLLIFQLYVIIICLGWLTLLIVTHSSWIRMGSIFGIICALFMTTHIIIFSLSSDLSLHVHALINAITCLSLLGSYICLSIDKTPSNYLDAWLFGLAPLIACIAVALIYFLTPPIERSLITLENAIAATALVLSILILWVRPALWKSQPGPTFLFGSVPLILLIRALSNKVFSPSNFFLAQVLGRPIPNLHTNESNFFFTQLSLLLLFLGIVRLIQAERSSSTCSCAMRFESSSEHAKIN
ncbi:MAG TPA: hypothetical protein VED37_07690 [Ktedonobacteraceae bacterium]|nr:hypothetical protein [Ktedonobacteraceae bacterium]